MQFPCITYYHKRQYTDQNTNIVKIYVYASE